MYSQYMTLTKDGDHGDNEDRENKELYQSRNTLPISQFLDHTCLVVYH